MSPLIAEDLLLLLLDDESGKLSSTTSLDAGLGGAVLVELALSGCVEVVEGTGLWARAKVRPVPGALPPDDVLRDSLAVVAEQERTAADLVERLGRKRRDPLLERLERAGILERREDKLFGLFPRRRWPALDSSREADVRRQIGDALLRGVRPDDRTAALISLLSALEIAHKVVDREGLSSSQVKKRAKAIAEGDWAAKAVHDAVLAVQSALVVVVAATTAGTSGN